MIEDKKNPQIVILPFGKEEDLFAVEAESADVNTETDNLRGILESFAHDTPRTGDPEDSHAPPLVTVLDTVFLYGIIKEKRTDDVLVSFCTKGMYICFRLYEQLLHTTVMCIYFQEPSNVYHKIYLSLKEFEYH